MKKKTLTKLLLALCLSAQLSFCSAEQDYDEEITLPIGTNFDLEMEEVTRYEYDGEYVKALTVNNKEEFILQKTGDTIITVIMDDKGVKTELRVLVHIVSEQQFNNPNAAAPTASAAQPAATADTKQPANTAKPGTAAPSAINVPAATATPPSTVTTASKPAESPAKPAATQTTATAANTQITQAAAPTEQPTTPAKPAENTAATATTQTATTAANTQITQAAAPTAQQPAASAKSAEQAPAKLEALVTAQTITRPSAQPQTSVEAVKYKAEQYAFDVLDLVNAERAKYNLRPLSMAKDLMGEAVLRARELPARFSHTRPDGSKYFTVMSNPGLTNGENIAAGQATPAAVVKAWLNSTVHRETILSPAYTELGVGYYETASATYPCYWIQLFRG